MDLVSSAVRADLNIEKSAKGLTGCTGCILVIPCKLPSLMIIGYSQRYTAYYRLPNVTLRLRMFCSVSSPSKAKQTRSYSEVSMEYTRYGLCLYILRRQYVASTMQWRFVR